MSKEYYKKQVIQICSDYAGRAHKGQFRKDKMTPYITHPARVAQMVAKFLDGSKSYIYEAAAWLHDVMEDCSEIVDGEYSGIITDHFNGDIYKFLTTHNIISTADGEEIFALTEALTMSQNKLISKKDRKNAYYDKITHSGQGAVLIKCCDRIDNLITVHHFSQDGFKLYISDTENLQKKIDEDILSISEEAHIIFQEALEDVKIKYKEMYK